MVSIPFEQGDVFRRFSSIYHFSSWHVSNPFRAGRCLSTQKLFKTMPCIRVSIPFEQGDVFRRDVENVPVAGTEKSQSLSSRAMSFDCTYGTNTQARTASLNPFRSGRCLSTLDTHGIVSIFDVSIPFDQGDVFRQRSKFKRNNKQRVSIPFDQGDVFRLLGFDFMT